MYGKCLCQSAHNLVILLIDSSSSSSNVTNKGPLLAIAKILPDSIGLRILLKQTIFTAVTFNLSTLHKRTR